MVTWADLKDHIDMMDEDQLSELVEVSIPGRDSPLMVEDVRSRGDSAPVLELADDKEFDGGDDEGWDEGGGEG